MSKRFFTSDWHLGSASINVYAKRPYNSAHEAQDSLIANCNLQAKDIDVVFHVGDFLLKGHDRHASVEDIGTGITKDEALSKIKPRFVLIFGNHDDGHSCESDLNSLTLNLNQNYYNVTVAHYPSTHPSYKHIGNNKTFSLGNAFMKNNSLKTNMHIHLCGHVHDAWMLFYDRYNNVLNINVGVDCWDYKPIEDVDITALLDFIFTAKVKMPKDKMTKVDVGFWKKLNECTIIEDRDKRKAKKYAEKGLTPEICQQKKEAAMRAKGLIK